MSVNVLLNVNTANSVPKDTVIYEKEDDILCIALVLKGKVLAQSEGSCVELGVGSFLGLNDLQKGKFSFTYKTLEDSSIYGLPINTSEQASLLLDDKPQYRGLFVASGSTYITALKKNYDALSEKAESIAQSIFDFYNKYKKYTGIAGMIAKPTPTVERLVMQSVSDYELPEKTDYYIECAKVPSDKQKNYFQCSAMLTREQFEGQNTVIEALYEGCQHFSSWVQRCFRAIVSDEANLLSTVCKTAMELNRSGGDSSDLVALVDDIVAEVNSTETLLTKTSGNCPKVDRKYIEQLYYALLSNDTEELELYEEQNISGLDGSFEQILEYSGVDQERVDSFKNAMEEFLLLPDKFGKSDKAKKIRKEINEHFFEVYEAVALKSFQSKTMPLPVQMFLNYGYMSEQLVSESDIKELAQPIEIDNEVVDCKVYTFYEWLKMIYIGEKTPSKNEFDEDYDEEIRRAVGEGRLDKKQAEKELKNKRAKVHFEVSNLFKYADRLINGNITSFVPVFCSEAVYTKLDSSKVMPGAINQEVRKIEKIDYSIFYREFRVGYEKVDVSTFINVNRFAPDFIIFPVYGRNALMWQDMVPRVKASHGRIIMPAFLEHKIEDEMIKMMAYFRWEKCRSEMGAQWNNFRFPSLTGAYTDYLQFYKKNSDLSQEKREKIKAQLQQSSNRHKEVFLRDYMDWILRESTGAMKLNRVSREILYTYCPFSEEYGKALLSQNAYMEAAKKHIAKRRQDEKSIKVILNKFEKSGTKVPKEIMVTKKYLLEQ